MSPYRKAAELVETQRELDDFEGVFEVEVEKTKCRAGAIEFAAYSKRASWGYPLWLLADIKGGPGKLARANRHIGRRYRVTIERIGDDDA